MEGILTPLATILWAPQDNIIFFPVSSSTSVGPHRSTAHPRCLHRPPQVLLLAAPGASTTSHRYRRRCTELTGCSLLPRQPQVLPPSAPPSEQSSLAAPLHPSQPRRWRTMPCSGDDPIPSISLDGGASNRRGIFPSRTDTPGCPSSKHR